MFTKVYDLKVLYEFSDDQKQNILDKSNKIINESNTKNVNMFDESYFNDKICRVPTKYNQFDFNIVLLQQNIPLFQAKSFGCSISKPYITESNKVSRPVWFGSEDVAKAYAESYKSSMKSLMKFYTKKPLVLLELLYQKDTGLFVRRTQKSTNMLSLIGIILSKCKASLQSLETIKEKSK